MKKKAITVLVPIILILIIGGAAFGKLWLDKYSYSKEMADMDAYYQVAPGELAIILQDEMIAEKAVEREGYLYLELGTVHQYLNEIFYVDKAENLLLYTTATEVVRANLGEKAYSSTAGAYVTDYIIAYPEGEEVYVAMDYVKLFTNYSYEAFGRHIQVYTRWGSRETAPVLKDTWVRERGGVKSPILREVAQGETVEILEKMETWSKVKTEDSIIGYIENKRLGNTSFMTEKPVTDYVAPEYTSLRKEGKVSMGWHAIGGPGGNDTLNSMVSGTKGMNVIAPTWFSLNDNQGNFRSFASTAYVERAHALGLEVWGVWDDFNYSNESDTEISVYQILSSTSIRSKLVQGIVDTAVGIGLDGVNLDFEKVSSDCGIHFVQFLRELSVQCRANGLVLSVDNYVPFHFNDYYRLDVQGIVADYVIIMGYDEHWHGSGDPGSVASIDYVTNGLERTIQEVPAEKVINALPFYTIVWKTEGATVTDEYLTIANTADFLNRMNVTPEWDETTCQNYAEWMVGDTTYQIWIEDAESIRVKLNVMNTQKVGGVAVWRLGYGTSGIWELLNAYSGS